MSDNETQNPWTKRPDFKPMVHYHDSLDYVYVVAVDADATRVRINDVLDLLKADKSDNGEDRYVGFIIKSAREFCIKHRLKYRGNIDLVEFIEKILITDPCPIKFQDEIYRILTLSPTYVNISDRSFTVH